MQEKHPQTKEQRFKLKFTGDTCVQETREVR